MSVLIRTPSCATPFLLMTRILNRINVKPQSFVIRRFVMENEPMLSKLSAGMRNAPFKARSHYGLCCWLVVVLTLILIMLARDERASFGSLSFVRFIYAWPRPARRIDYFLSMQNIAKERATRYPPNVKYKWLFLTTAGIYRQVMDRHFFSMYDAAKRHPNINATLWGRDFPGGLAD